MRMSLPQERTHSSRGLYTYSGAVARGGPGVGKLSMLSEIVGKLSMLSEIVKDVDGGWGVAEDLKCCRPENFLVCRKKFSVCRKSTALGSPPKKNHGSHGATAYLIILLF